MSDQPTPPDLRTLLAEAERPSASCAVRINATTELVFHFKAPTYDQREDVRVSMEGRDNPDEMDLRATAAVLEKTILPDGTDDDTKLTWEDFRTLRDSIGVPTYDATIKAKSDSVWSPQWSIPFSSTPSPTLETAT